MSVTALDYHICTRKIDKQILLPGVLQLPNIEHSYSISLEILPTMMYYFFSNPPLFATLSCLEQNNILSWSKTLFSFIGKVLHYDTK